MSDTAAGASSLRPFYADWFGYNRRWIEGLRRLTPEDLELLVPARRDWGDEPWPIWAVAAHRSSPLHPRHRARTSDY